MLKLSGQALSGEHEYGIDRAIVQGIARTVRAMVLEGIEVAIVVGAGNLLRGTEAAREGMDRATADYAGMLGTAINALVLQDMLESNDVETRVQSAITMNEVAEPFIRRRAMRHLEKGRVVIFAAGTGNPFFTTDTAAVLRATEIGAEVIVKATNVDGVYDDDPNKNPEAKLLSELTFSQALQQGLRIMDATAFSLAMENDLPILVLNIDDPENIRRALNAEPIGTLVRGKSNG
ncbi:MAG: UMP kinase [Armatimonadia bacterium]|jgi:uridylate kinase|nr:UMP kinase [Armatimonadia bacterium]